MGTISASGERQERALGQRDRPQQRPGGTEFRVCSRKNECPDSGFFLSQQLRHFL